MGGVRPYLYPKYVWSPSGGWWANPKNGKRNAWLFVGVSFALGIAAINFSAKRQVGCEYRAARTSCAPISAMLLHELRPVRSARDCEGTDVMLRTRSCVAAAAAACATAGTSPGTRPLGAIHAVWCQVSREGAAFALSDCVNSAVPWLPSCCACLHLVLACTSWPRSWQHGPRHAHVPHRAMATLTQVHDTTTCMHYHAAHALASPQPSTQAKGTLGMGLQASAINHRSSAAACIARAHCGLRLIIVQT